MSENGNGCHNVVVPFKLSPSSVLKIQKGDISLWFINGSSDAIVNPTNELMVGPGAANNTGPTQNTTRLTALAVHNAAGPELLKSCYKIPEVRPGVRCPTGEARITPGFKLPVSHVVHTVGPNYSENTDPEEFLRRAYRNSLLCAKENGIQYIAFPAISCGVNMYPYDGAAAIAISSVKEFANDLKEVQFVLFTDDIYNVWLKKANELLCERSAPKLSANPDHE